MTADPVKRRILVVDDEMTVGKSISQALACDDYEIDTALSGAEALQKENRSKYDVIIADLMMPGLHGLEVTRQVNQRSPNVRIIVLSMHANEAYVLEALRNGATGYVLKESSTETLVTARSEGGCGTTSTRAEFWSRPMFPPTAKKCVSTTGTAYQLPGAMP